MVKFSQKFDLFYSCDQLMIPNFKKVFLSFLIEFIYGVGKNLGLGLGLTTEKIE